MSKDDDCRQCGHPRYAHSPFHGGKCIAAMCDCSKFVSTDRPVIGTQQQEER